MVVGKVIDGPVHFNAGNDLRLIAIIEVTPFHKVADEIANHDFGPVSGKVEMGEKIHRILRRNGCMNALQVIYGKVVEFALIC